MYLIKALVKLIVVFFLLPLSICAQQTGFEIDGYMGGLKEGSKVYLNLISNNAHKPESTDSAYVKNGSFHFKSVAQEGPRFYILDFEKPSSQWARLLIDNGEHVTIRCPDVTKIRHDGLDEWISVEGSLTNKTYYRFGHTAPLYSQSIFRLDARHLLTKIQDSIGFDPYIMAGVIAAKDEIEQALYFNYLYSDFEQGFLSNKVIPFLVRQSGMNPNSKHPAVMLDIYNRLEEPAKNSYYGKWLKEATKLCVGQPFPLFTLPDVDGRTVSLSAELPKAKLTLVNFWSLVSTTRSGAYFKGYQDELLAMFKKYHDKGLNVIAVSSDTAAWEWRGVVKSKQYPWINVSDLKGSEGLVGKLYKEYGDTPETPTPNFTNVLIDSQGKIVAWDANGPELEYYLWKYLNGKPLTASK